VTWNGEFMAPDLVLYFTVHYAYPLGCVHCGMTSANLTEYVKPLFLDGDDDGANPHACSGTTILCVHRIWTK